MIVGLGLVASNVMLAQQTVDAPKTEKEGEFEQLTPEERAQKRTDKMTEALGLDKAALEALDDVFQAASRVVLSTDKRPDFLEIVFTNPLTERAIEMLRMYESTKSSPKALAAKRMTKNRTEKNRIL